MKWISKTDFCTIRSNNGNRGEEKDIQRKERSLPVLLVLLQEHVVVLGRNLYKHGVTLVLDIRILVLGCG